MASERWDKDIDEGVVRIVGQLQLRKYGKFMEDLTTQFKNIEQSLDQSITEAWDVDSDLIAIQWDPVENTTLLELVSTDNKVLNKVMTVLAALCSEMKELCHEAKSRFHDALLFYGEGSLSSNNVPDGESQVAVGRMIGLMQDLSCHVSRCYLVAKKRHSANVCAL